MLRAGLLRDVGGQTYVRLAAILGCSETAAKYRVHTHRALLVKDPPYARLATRATSQALKSIS
jgi:hypothetical protein